MVFTDVLACWPGSVHDSRVLQNSGLWHQSANKFLGDTHLLGDGGYPLFTGKFLLLLAVFSLCTSNSASEKFSIHVY